MYLAAVKQDGVVLRVVPAEFATPDIFLAAVLQNGEAIQYVPREHQTQELILASVKQCTPTIMNKENGATVPGVMYGGGGGDTSYSVFDEVEYGKQGLLFGDLPFGAV